MRLDAYYYQQASDLAMMGEQYNPPVADIAACEARYLRFPEPLKPVYGVGAFSYGIVVATCGPSGVYPAVGVYGVDPDTLDFYSDFAIDWPILVKPSLVRNKDYRFREVLSLLPTECCMRHNIHTTPHRKCILR